MISKIILIGNYLPDKQESMIRFANLLHTGFTNQGVESEIWCPKIMVGATGFSTNAGFGKWLGYLDKYVLFPMVIKRRIRKEKLNNSSVRFHICDHSNAPYLKYLPAKRTSITCHDVIAIRGGLGFTDSYVTASKMGKLLQNWILKSLKMATSIAFVSQNTFDQFKDLIPDKIISDNWKVIHNSLNNDFKLMDKQQAKVICQQNGLNLTFPFLLHVGSNLVRKNRLLLLDMVSFLGKERIINICFAGDDLEIDLITKADKLGLKNQVVCVVKPDHETLVALYNCCDAFIFPSLSEGFGWPLIEAQACGAPVIASNYAPMPEVSGGAALHYDPKKPRDFAAGYEALQNDDFRNILIQKGLENSVRFESKNMIKAYIGLMDFN